MDIQDIISVWLMFLLGLSFFSLKWAVLGFIIHSMLVPIMQIRIGGVVLGENFVRIFLILSFIIYYLRKRMKIDWLPFIPFVSYFILNILIIPFQDGMPYSEMLNRWRLDVMNCLIIPFLMWYVFKVEPSALRLFKYSILFVIAISIGYGLLLTQFDGLNPYVTLFSGIMNSRIDYESYYAAQDSGRIFGRISSVYFHPMSFALFIGLSLLYLFYLRKSTNKIIVYLLFTATGVMSMLCGVRSVIGGLLVAIVYFLYVGRNYRMMITTSLIVALVWSVLSNIPGLEDYVGSIFDITSKNEAVSGSSVEMRLKQLSGAIKIASSNPLFGMGYGWTGYYGSLKGDHPVCLAFESLIYVIMCNSGLFGFIFWTIMVIQYFQITKKLSTRESIVTSSLFIFYLSFSTITGEFGYMKTFIIFYILILGESKMVSKIAVNQLQKRRTKTWGTDIVSKLIEA